MKILKITQLFLLMAFVTCSLDSCLKSNLPTAQNGYFTSSLVQEASITDLGLVSDTVRKLMVIIKGFKYTLTNDYGTFLQTGAVVEIELSSNKDGIIPSGKYIYNSSNSTNPFTFSNAFISDGAGFIDISNGSITVSSNNPAYSLLFECSFADGEYFTAKYNGGMLYTDNYK